MPSTRDIRRRIKSVKNTSQITKAMQMVAASKMRRAQDAAQQGKPYTEQFNRILVNIKDRVDDIKHPFLESRPDDKPCVLLVTTDKGLCGPLNTNLIREASKMPANTRFVTIGRKGRRFISRIGRDLLADFELPDRFSFPESKQVSKFLTDQFLEGKIDSVSVLYPYFVNTLSQRATLVRLLPLTEIRTLGGRKEDEEKHAGAMSDHLFEPSARTVMDKLLPAYIHFMTYEMILNARASEHSARMVAMKTATDNANQLIKDLTLEYNKARQAAITKELLEISSAQMALG